MKTLTLLLTLLASEDARAKQLLASGRIAAGNSPETEGVRAHT